MEPFLKAGKREPRSPERAGGGERKTLNTGQGLDYVFSLSMLLFFPIEIACPCFG